MSAKSNDRNYLDLLLMLRLLFDISERIYDANNKSLTQKRTDAQWDYNDLRTRVKRLLERLEE